MRSRRRLFRAALLLAVPNVLLVTAAFVWTSTANPADANASIDFELLGGLMGIALLIAVAWTFLLARLWVLPIERINAALLNYAAADSPPHITPGGAAPLRRMTHRLNRTLGDTERLISQLRTRGATLQTLLDALPDPIVLTDVDQKVAVLNEPAARLLQTDAQRAKGQAIVNVINDEAILNLLETLSSQYPLRSGEVRLRREGKRVVFKAIAVRAATGELLLELQDVTTLATAMQMKTDFVANASHELRTPIAAIKVAFETLNEVRGDDPAQAERCTNIVDGQLRRLEEMLRDLLDLARVENAESVRQLERVDVSELFRNLDDQFPAESRRKLREFRWITDPPPAETTLFTDRRLMQLVLKNLIENSLKFTPKDGSIVVRLRIDGDSAEFSVTDTGIGIAPEHQQRIFERFYQVDPARSSGAGRGTGLGLAIVKHAVHSLRGKLELRSELGRGTTILCRLPLDQTVAAQSK